MNQKGQAEQFNWIFVIISGAILLGFFSLFIFKYIELQQKRFDISIARDFGTAIELLSRISAGSSTSLDSSQGEGFHIGSVAQLDTSCQDGRFVLEVNQDSDASYRFRDALVFAPSSLHVRSLDLWLLPWSFPFPVSNLLFLSDPEQTYYFIYDSFSSAEVLAFDIPEAFTVKKVSKLPSSIDKPAHLIFFTSEKPISSILQRFDVPVIFADLRRKTVQFYEGGSWSEAIPYYDSPLLYGAFFSDSSSQYSCMLDAARARISFLSSLHAEKANLLSRLDLNPKCSYDALSRNLRNFGKGDYTLLEPLTEDNMRCTLVF